MTWSEDSRGPSTSLGDGRVNLIVFRSPRVGWCHTTYTASRDDVRSGTQHATQTAAKTAAVEDAKDMVDLQFTVAEKYRRWGTAVLADLT